MRFVLHLVFVVGVLAATGCGRSDKNSVHEPTAEEIQQQKDAQELANAEESAMRKKQPKETKDKTHAQTVEEQERARRR